MFAENDEDGIILSKGGDTLDLSKTSKLPLKHIRVELSWDPREKAHPADDDFDLDAVFFALSNADGSPKLLKGSLLCFYNSVSRTKDDKEVFRDQRPYPEKEGFPTIPGLGIIHRGDSQTGESKGVDETGDIYMDRLPPEIDEVAVFVDIFEAVQRGQHFGMVNNSFIKVYNADDPSKKPLCTYRLNDKFNGNTIVHFGSIIREADGHVSFKAVGIGFNDGLAAVINGYGVKV